MSLAEVAKLAGVSPATVSRVMNDSPLVRSETAERVRRAAVDVGYDPSAKPVKRRRRAERRGGRQSIKSRRVGVITLGQSYQEWVSMPVIGSFVAGLMAAAHEYDVDVMLDEMPKPDEQSRLVRRGEIGGAIVLITSTMMDDPAWVRAVGELVDRMPLVWAMGGHTAHVKVDHVLPDNIGIGHMAASHLADQGCRRVANITTTPHWPLSRQRIIMAACSALDMGMEVVNYLVSDNPAVEQYFPGQTRVVASLSAVAEQLTQPGARPDGLFVPRDYETARLYPALIQAGLRPMEDVKIISCDNDAPQLSMMDPMPITMDLHIGEIARRAIRQLRMRMRHRGDPPTVINVQPTIVKPDASALAALNGSTPH